MTKAKPVRVEYDAIVDGRPILSEDDLLRHYAYKLTDQVPGAWGWTWCGEPVPADHMCPLANNLESQLRAFQRPVGNCPECDEWYRAGARAPRKLPESEV